MVQRPIRICSAASSCEIAVKRGRRILLSLEERQNESREHELSPALAGPPTPLLDHPDLFTQIAHGCQVGSGKTQCQRFMSSSLAAAWHALV